MSQASPFESGRTTRTILGHPPGLFLLFLVEMWERFSYYGMRGLLVLYLVTVMAAHQLPKGVYSNEIRLTEVKQQADPRAESDRSVHQSRIVQLVVGDSAQPEAATPAATGEPRLVIERLKPDSKDPASWIVDGSAGPVVFHGPVGGTSDRGTRGLDMVETRFRVRNPGTEPVKAEIEINRPAPDSHTYFTLNDEVGLLAVEIKPDSALTGEEKPYDIVVAPNLHDSGRNWPATSANVLYGWYTGLAYLFPILGGILADKLIGTHRSMVVGGLLIAMGHTILGISGIGELAHNAMGMSIFTAGLAVVILGTGHFKPCVSVMVGQLYPQGDPRRDGAFTIFYMGINLGAFLCAFVCGTLGEKVGWHWGFASAAVGMVLGLMLYAMGRPRLLAGIGEAPRTGAGGASALLFIGSLVVAGLVGLLFHLGFFGTLSSAMKRLQENQGLSLAVIAVLLAGILGWAGWFISINRPEDRGPVVTIFVFMLFNAFFWMAFEQAGSSLNIFTKVNTNRMIGSFEVPATWFQSVNAGLIFILAPVFAGLWTALGKRRMNPSQPMKIALGLMFLGLGYVFMVVAGKLTIGGAAKASMFYILATYFWHTVGELFLSPTGLAYVTKAAPVRFVSLLMGIWFVSNFIANLGGGLVAAQVEKIEKGTLTLPWHFGGKADFFFVFVATSVGAGVVMLVLTPFMKRLMRNPGD